MGKEVAGKKNEVDSHVRLVYLLVAFGIVTVLVVIGCFGCSNDALPLGEADALVLLQKLSGTVWEPDSSQRPVELEGVCIARLEFGTVPDADMNLAVIVFCDDNFVGESGELHGNSHGLTLTMGTAARFEVQYSASADGSTETLSLVGSDKRKAYFQKKASR